MKLNKNQLENYSHLVTAFNCKLNTETPEKLLPIMSAYAASMQKADSDQCARDSAVTLFSDGVHAILSDCLKDYLTVQSESFYLKLAAAENLADIVTRLENQFDGSFRYTRQLLKDFIADYPVLNIVAAFTEKSGHYNSETEQILSELASHLQRTSSPESQQHT